MFKNKRIDILHLPTTNKMLEVVIIGERSRSNGNLEVTNLISITQLKIVKAYSVIETFCQTLVVRIESGGPSWPFIPHTLLTKRYKNVLTYL
jgi:hypothetical protein